MISRKLKVVITNEGGGFTIEKAPDEKNILVMITEVEGNTSQELSTHQLHDLYDMFLAVSNNRPNRGRSMILDTRMWHVGKCNREEMWIELNGLSITVSNDDYLNIMNAIRGIVIACGGVW